MECCISVGSSAVGKVGELMVQYVNCQLEFVFFYKKHLGNLKESALQLENTEKRLEISIEKAFKNLEEIHDDVQHWRNKVGDIIKEAKRIVEQAEAQGDVRCGHGWFPNWKLRHRLGKEASGWELKVREMLNTAPDSERVSYQPDRQCHIENEGYESFESRRRIFDDIWQALGNDHINVIGVYGMAGVGKTMLVKEVARQAFEEKLFNEVIITTVSQKRDYGRIQLEIAQQLGLNFFDKTEISKRKDLLRKRLELRKEEADEDKGIEKEEANKDEGTVKEKADKDERTGKEEAKEDEGTEKEKSDKDEGIGKAEVKEDAGTEKDKADEDEGTEMEEAEIKQNPKKKILIVLDDIWEKIDLDLVGISFMSGWASCKLILTSRNGDVIRDDMDVTQYFPVSFLSDDEAKNLFNKIVKGKAENPDFKELAESIVEECACLPIAIDTVASALKNKSVYEWRDALKQLQASVPTDIKEMDKRVFKSIQTSYDFLNSEEAQSLLLLCCLYEEDANIDAYHLLMHGIGWGMFGYHVNKLEEAKCRIHKLIEKLKDHCLLLKGDYDWSVKVHDVVRDFGIYFARVNKQIYNIRSDEELDKWLEEKKPEKSAAISLQYDSIKSLPHRLECPKLELFWAWRDSTLQLQDLFFKESKELKVLDLSSLSLLQPPSSLCYLDNLRTLRLSSCKLESVDWIGELKNLKILDLSRSNIENLPEEIGQLTRLQLLDLDECYRLKKIHPGVLSKLTRLEELNMRGTSIEWEAKQEEGETKNNASLNELRDMCRLTALHMCINSAHIAPKDLFNNCKLERYDISVNYPSWDLGKKLGLFITKTLRLNLEGSRLLDYDLGMLLESCEEMQLEGGEDVDSLVPGAHVKSFRQLKHLECKRAKIQYIINSAQQSRLDCGAFKLLETLKLVSLERLECVCRGNLPPDSFSNLTDLKVYRCRSLRNLFSLSMATHLSQLQNIEIIDCKKIEEVVVHDGECSKNSATTIFPKLQTVRLERLPELLTFCSFEFMSSQRTLPLLCGQRLAPKLKELEIRDCGSVRCLFSSSFAAILSQLNQLEIRFCRLMEEIVMVDEKKCALRFPLLKSLKLDDLPELVRFYRGPSLQFPALDVLQLSKCPALVAFVSNSLSANISESSDQGDIYHSKVSIFNNELVASNLTELKIEDCRSLKSLCSPYFAAKLMKLNRLEIKNCSMMEEIIMADERKSTLKFPLLEYLELDDLLKLTSFYSGRSLQFPALNVLQLSKCPELDTFVSNSLSTNISEPFDQSYIHPGKVSLFNNEIVAPNLTELTIEDCGSIKSLCSPFFAEKLVKLNQLKIRNCSMVEEIVSLDRIANRGLWVNKIGFPQLKHLELHGLTKLSRFFSGIPVQFPSKRSKDNTGSSIISLFNDNAAFPSLEFMDIRDIEKLNAIWDGQHAADSFCQLREVCLTSMNNAVIDNLMRRQQNLRRLLAYKCKIAEEVSLSGVDIEGSCHSLQNSQLQLIISDSQFKLALSPPTISLWKNVTLLWIHSCHVPESLLTHAAAKGLQQLKAMLICDCENMTEVIATEGGDTKGGEIDFRQLELLVLKDLPRLTSFCSGSYVLRFPKLTHLGVNGCPGMMRFSKQVTGTPQLKKVTLNFGNKEFDDKFQEHLKPEDFVESLDFCLFEERPSEENLSLSEDSVLIEGNINNTIQHLWELQLGISLQRLFAEKPRVPIVVLKVDMHCEGCARNIKRSILRIKGVESAQFDIRRSQVTIKGNLDPTELVEYVYMRTRKRAVVVTQDFAEESEVSNFVELNYRNLFNYYPPSHYGHPLHIFNDDGYPPQIFNDENPNACSVM